MFKRFFENLRARKKAERALVLDELKIRYHTFRILLANNERALDILAAVEAAFNSGAAKSSLASFIEDLEDVTFELVDGLSRLRDDGRRGLYARHLRIEESLRSAMDAMEDDAPAPFCLPIEGLGAEGAGLSGGKAASLFRLMQNGFPTPDGFVVTVRACREILRLTGLEDAIREFLRGLDAGSDPKALREAAQNIDRAIMAADLPPEFSRELAVQSGRLLENGLGSAAFAVRSSALTEDAAEHSFAGQFVTELNVQAEGLETAFRKVLAGAFSERALAYRMGAGLPAAVFDMAALVQPMVPAKAAGVMFTLDPVAPESGRMFISAGLGLGVTVVDGEAPTDVFRPLRENIDDVESTLAEKTVLAVPAPEGGLTRREPVGDERHAPVLDEPTLRRLCRLGLAAEALAGSPQDVEWAVTGDGRVILLQSRPVRLSSARRGGFSPPRPEILLRGAATASAGRCLGRARIFQDAAALVEEADEPVIALLPVSLPDAAKVLPRWQGLAVDMGNPADHLSIVARELGLPMLTRTGRGTETVAEGSLAVLDADAGAIYAAPGEIGDLRDILTPPGRGRAEKTVAPLSPARRQVHDLTIPLNLTDAYGPSFSIQECRSLHDVIRYAHEMAVMAMFEAGDETLEESFSLVRRLEGDLPFQVMVIDLGGGLVQDAPSPAIGIEHVACAPLRALWQGALTPGLRWSVPPPNPNLSGLFSRGLTDARSARPIGNPNYALAARDYVNVNARVEFHFAMIDAVCGPKSRGNHVRFRFKGGGTEALQRDRRAECVALILREGGFFTDQRGDLVSASMSDIAPETAEEALGLLGKILGFTRLLDASMTTEDAPKRAAAAFLAGDYALESFENHELN